MIYTTENYKLVAQLLKNAKVGIIPTDTIYGIVGSALNKKTVEKIYAIRGRDLKKPMIILISSMHELKKFAVKLDTSEKNTLQKKWPGPVSVIFKCATEKFEYLHRGTNSLAFRLPDNSLLQNILKISGPLVAPSANPQDKKPATTIDEARAYFGIKVDFYMDGGKLNNLPSTIIKLENGKITLIRKGAKKVVQAKPSSQS